METVSGLFSSFTSLPLDWIVLGGIIIVFAFDSIRGGIGRAIVLSIAMPLALVFYPLAQKAAILSSVGLFSSSLSSAIMFGVVFVALYLLIRRIGIDYIDSGMGEPMQSLLAGTAVAAIFTCVWLQEPALSGFWALSEPIQSIFAEPFRLWWLLGSYAALAFARG